MTIFRAIFWLGIMVLLVPHDPSLGLAGAPASHLIQGAACTADMNTCVHEQNSVASMRELFISRIAQVRADLAAAKTGH